MRKIFSLTLAILLGLSMASAAFAEDAGAGRSSYDGYVTASESVSITAPFGGKVEDFNLSVGDAVGADDILLSLSTTKVYAPEDGTVNGLRARVGDAAADVESRYGALCYIETKGRYRIETNTSESYDEKETRYVYVGEKVYLRSTASNDRIGVGTIISVDGSNFVVEVSSSNLRVNENTGIFRESSYSSESRIGRGKTKRQNPIAVSGVGSINKCYVSEGESVRRGDLLFELVDGSLDGLAGAAPGISSNVGGVVADIHVKAGDTVSKNQTLLTIHPEGKLRIEATVNESDLHDVKVGSSVKIEIDALESYESLTGTIRSISFISSATSGDAEYTVYIDFTAPAATLREGMSATVYPIG